MNHKRILVLLMLCSLPVKFFAADQSFWSKSYGLEQQLKYDEAIAHLQKKGTTSDNTEFLELRLGWLHYLNRDYNISINHYQKALKLNSRSIDGMVGILSPLAAQQRWNHITEICTQILNIAPFNYQAHLFLMQARQNQKRWSVLKLQAGSLAERFPTQVDPLIFLARAHLGTGDTQAAATAYRKVLMLYPTNVEAASFLASTSRASTRVSIAVI